MKKTLNCNGKLLSLEEAKVMGILNLGDRSFYDGGQYLDLDKAMAQVERMIEDGVDVVDLGPSSSKPGEKISDPEEEIKCIIPIIEGVLKRFPETILSIDSYHAKVVRVGIEAGAHIINDISAGAIDEEMLNTVIDLDVPYIMMHMNGVPENMQKNTNYDNIYKEMIAYFLDRVTYLRNHGVKDIVLDPGFGFGKTIEQNYYLLKHLNVLEMFDLPVLAGLSRKSMIYKLLEIEANDALNGTSVLNLLALQNGASILRVHDVKEAKETIKLYNYFYGV